MGKLAPAGGMMGSALPRSTAIALATVVLMAGVLQAIARPARAANTAISATSPPDGERNVNLSKSILVSFTSPMDPASVTWSILPPVPVTAAWSRTNTLLNLTPAASLAPCTLYTVEVRGNDSAGDPTVPGPIPNPWNFSTESARPCIVSTIPADGAVDFPPGGGITIDFSAPFNPIPLPADAFVLTPSSGVYSMVWSFTRLVVLVSLAPCTAYTAGFRDSWGYVPGLVPNPWSFATACPQVFIESTDPADGTAGVPANGTVTVVFSDRVDPGSVSWNLTPSVPVGSSWLSPRTLRLKPLVGFTRCTAYTVLVSAPGLTAGPVPNPWSFTTACTAPSAPGNLTATEGNRRVSLFWSPPFDDGGFPVTGYRMYRGITPGGETLIADIGTGTTYVDVEVANRVRYDYRVSAVNSVGEGPRSNVAAATPFNTPPSLRIDAPTAGEVSGITVILGTAFDLDGVVALVEVRIDGGAWAAAEGTQTWRFTWDTTRVANGDHIVEVRAFDDEDVTVAQRLVTVNNPPPPIPPNPRGVWAAAALSLGAFLAFAIALIVLYRRQWARSRNR